VTQTTRANALSSILAELGHLEDAHLFRQTRCVADLQTDHPVAGLDRAVPLCSNDYLGLAADARLTEAAVGVAQYEGFGAGAARLISGTRTPHDVLERELAAYFGTESALSLSSGYAANLAVLGALLGPEDLAVSDARNHASLIDGLRLSRATRRVVSHADPLAFREAVADARDFRRIVVVTEGLFSMDGDLAPLGDLLEVTRGVGGLLLVDDAHGTGVLGPTGRGSLELAGIGAEPDVVRVGTFGKAFGAAGAFVAAVQPVVDLVVNRGRAFVFSTATPPLIAAACSEALRITQDEIWRRRRWVARRPERRWRDGGTRRGPHRSARAGIFGTGARRVGATRARSRLVRAGRATADRRRRHRPAAVDHVGRARRDPHRSRHLRTDRGPSMKSAGLMVIGTDTAVGKTRVGEHEVGVRRAPTVHHDGPDPGPDRSRDVDRDRGGCCPRPGLNWVP
jgi:7-keto-8-aminopelargonate synthetase-like enzyme